MENNRFENGGSKPAYGMYEDMPQENLFSIAIRHRWLILNTTILFLIIGFVYILKATPIYRSESRLYVEQSGPKIINEYEGVMTRSKNYLYTQGEVIKSSPIIASVIEDPTIRNFRSFATVDSLPSYLKKNIVVDIGKRDDIITISFESPYPEEAAQVVNDVVNSYIDFNSTKQQSIVSKVLNILRNEKVERDAELSEKFEELVKFTRENGVVSFDNNGEHIIFQKLAKLSEALTQSQLSTINAKADLEAVKSMADEPAKIKQFAAAAENTGVRVFINDVETQLLAELRNAEIELQNARNHVSEEHPSIKALNKKVELINKQLNDEAKEFADAYTEVMRLKHITAIQREQELSVSFETQLAQAQDLGVKATEYSALQSELKRAERICEILDNRIKELNVTEDTGALNISILEVAYPADGPSRPQKARVMTITLLLGMLFGGGLALLRDWLDYRLRSVEEISAVLGIPVLGVIPTMADRGIVADSGKKVWHALKRRIIEVGKSSETSGAVVTSSVVSDDDNVSVMESAKLIRSELRSKSRSSYSSARYAVLTANGKEHKPVENVEVKTAKPETETDPRVLRGQKVRLQPKSVIAEAYRTVRTAVFFGVPKGEAKTIHVTSPAPGDGKSTLASNLALAMAQAGQRTLILDADFRKPMQHNIFKIDKETGLSAVIAGDITLDEAIHSGPIKGLDILACGKEVPNPSEILNSNMFAETLKRLSERYDRVVIDSPPVSPVADAQILAATCDIVLLVLRAEKSTRRHSQQARDALMSVGGRLLGAVVNDVPRSKGRYGYYSGYGSYGGYGYYGRYGHDGEKKQQQV